MVDTQGLLALGKDLMVKFRGVIEYISDFASPYAGISSEYVYNIILALIALFVAYKLMLLFYVTTSGRRWKFLLVAIGLFFLLKFI